MAKNTITYSTLKKNSPKIYSLIQKEALRQKEGLEMIPSENYVSVPVLEALGSHLTNKYSEGFPGRRYYGGNEVIDEIENYAVDLAKKLFGVPAALVQPYSGSPANLIVTMGICQPGDVVMGLSLASGGHLTHGANLSFSIAITPSFTISLSTNP